MSNGPPLSVRLPNPGDMVAGKYILDRLLGQGGMGAVFAAKHVKLSKAVAIKIMLADRSNPEAATRFINEGRAAANIQNEHVVRVDDVDEEHGYAYMVLELLEGEDLSQLLERELTHRLPPHLVVGYVIQALRGVAQAHAIGIVHRDLKPSNLFLAKRPDGPPVVKVLDFGISKSQGSSALAASPSSLTSTKAMLGSPLYMSPEQLRSSKSVDHRADIWAFGVILYELMTGSHPFMGESLGELFAAILETEAVPLRQRVDGVPQGLEEVVARCLARRPENRFQNAAELAQALAPFASPMPSAGGPLLHGTAVLPPQSSGTGPGYSHVPAQPMQSQPGMSGASASGSRPQPVGGTVAFGAITPHPIGAMQQSSSGWQHTGSGSGGIPKSKAPLIIGLAFGGVLCVVGAALIGVYVHNSKKVGDGVVATSGVPSSASLSASSANVVPPPLPEPHASAPATGSPDGAASTNTNTNTNATASTATATSPAVTAKHPPPHFVPPSPKPADAPPAKPADAPPAKPPKPPVTPPANAGGNLQNAR